MELNASWTRESKLKAELEEEKQIHQQDVTTYLFELKESRDREMEWYGYKMLAEKKMTKQETRSEAEPRTPNNSKLDQFSNIYLSAGIQLSRNRRLAMHAGKHRLPQCVLLERALTKTSIRVARNPSHCELFIGVTIPPSQMESTGRHDGGPNAGAALSLMSSNGGRSDSPILCDWRKFMERSWMLNTEFSRLYIRGRMGSFCETHIAEGAVVTVEKDAEKRAIRFLVDGEEPKESDGTPFGWQRTGLTSELFNSIVGGVMMLIQADMAEVIPS